MFQTKLKEVSSFEKRETGSFLEEAHPAALAALPCHRSPADSDLYLFLRPHVRHPDRLPGLHCHKGDQREHMGRHEVFCLLL